MMGVESAGMTDIGKQRIENQDSLLVDDALRLYVVADGVGGHQAGKVASQMVVETILEGMTGQADGGSTEIISCHDPELTQDANHLLRMIHQANREVYTNAKSREDYNGMGSTISAVYLTDHTLIAANVGDSPIYLIRKDSIDLLSVPHTLENERRLLEGDTERTVVEAHKHIITRAMGAKKTVQADLCEIQYFPGDMIVICSDGLSDKLGPEEIKDVVTKTSPEAACRQLIDMANQRGGDDNITVVIFHLNRIESKKNRLFSSIKRFLTKRTTQC